MKNKIIIYILAILSIVFIGSGVYGYTLSTKEKEKPIVDNKQKEKIDIEYYLEDVKVDSIPTNEENGETYLFSKFVCDDGLSGNFDTNTWTFNIDKGEKGTCKVYFVKEKYNITLTPVNGINDDEHNVYTVKREDTGSFIIIPNEGYKYKESNCSNNKTGSWDSSTNTFTLSAVTSDIACKVTFDKKDFKIDIIVKNGKGNTSEKVYYGDSKSVIVEPNSGFDNPTVKCTNDQEAIYDSNSLSFEKVTSNTKCTITFNKTKIEKYTLKISNPTEFPNISITEGSAEIPNIQEGTTAKLTLQSSDETTIPNLNCTDEKGNKIIPNITKGNETETIRIFEFLEVKNNITCKITNK